MKFFIDTANFDQIQQIDDMGLLDGVTTNPTLMAKEKVDARTRLKEICDLVKGPVSAEVVSTDAEGMLREADSLVSIAENIVIKFPTIPEGVKALKKAVLRGIKVNMTLCFQPVQALVVAKLGATYCSPFIGRFDDQGEDGMELVRQIRTIYDNYGFRTQIIASSIRSTLHVAQAAEAGSDVATIPFSVMEKLLYHPMTDVGLKRFLDDWKKAQA